MKPIDRLKKVFKVFVTDKRNIALAVAIVMLLVGLVMFFYPIFSKMYNEYVSAKAMTEYYSYIASDVTSVTIP